MKDGRMEIEPLWEAPSQADQDAGYDFAPMHELDAQLQGGEARLHGREGERDARLAERLDALMAEADSEGFLLMNYGDLLALLAEVYAEEEWWLRENGWQVRRHLENAGFASAPDPLLERRRLKNRDNVVIYRAEEEVPFVRRRPYKKGLQLVKFITLCFPDLTAEETRHAGELVGEWVSNPLYHRHLKGMLRWYAHRRRLLDSRTVRTFREITPESDYELLTAQLLSLANMRGNALSARSSYQLERLLTLMGHPPGALHSLLHRSRCAPTPASHRSVPGRKLDPALLEHLEKETERARLLLAPLFSEPEEPKAPEKADTKGIEAFMEALSARTEWSLEEAEKLAMEYGKPLEILLEEANDVAMERDGTLFAEIGADAVYLDV